MLKVMQNGWSTNASKTVDLSMGPLHQMSLQKPSS